MDDPKLCEIELIHLFKFQETDSMLEYVLLS